MDLHRWFCSLKFLVSIAIVVGSFVHVSSLGAASLRRHTKEQKPLVVGYFPQWGFYYEKPYYAKSLISNGSIRFLGQLNYAQGFVTNGRCSLADPNADLHASYTAENSVNGKADDPASRFHGYFHQLKELKHKYRNLKVLISLEGKASDFTEDAKPQNRQAFVRSCVDLFIKGHFEDGIVEPGLFDGFDVDWESPKEVDAENFRALLAEFRQQMNEVKPGLKLSIAVGHSPRMLAGTDFSQVAPLVDQVGIMNYDYTGPWNETTGFLAPLFPPSSSQRRASIASSIESYEAAGVPREKLLMGIPFYGYSWTGVPNENSGLFQAGKGVRPDRPYNYIRTIAPSFRAYRDSTSKAPWLFDGQTFWTYDDPLSIRYKTSYAIHQKIGGVMIWELSNDTEDAELLHEIHRSLRHPLFDQTFESATTSIQQPAEKSTDSHSSSAQ